MYLPLPDEVPLDEEDCVGSKDDEDVELLGGAVHGLLLLTDLVPLSGLQPMGPSKKS